MMCRLSPGSGIQNNSEVSPKPTRTVTEKKKRQIVIDAVENVEQKTTLSTADEKVN